MYFNCLIVLFIGYCFLDLMWSKIWTSDTNRPKGRYFHTLTDPIVVASHEEEESNSNVKSCSMWMYGGKTSKNTYLNELWELHFPNADGYFIMLFLDY